ncbi:MAG: hypothetical protein L3K17_03750 [Thermoplasmata archaeon]|nr:hypothetical protein [Thermoplasmata archaeon]
MAPTISPTLELAKLWAEELGNSVSVLAGTNAEGAPVNVLQVVHGKVTVIILERGPGVVEIDCPQDIPQAVRERLETLTPKLRQQAALTFVQSILRHPRSSFSAQPGMSEGLHQIQRWVVTQIIRIDQEDPSTQNRLADAIQEVVSVFLAASTVIAAALNQPPPAATGSGAAGQSANPPGYA